MNPAVVPAGSYAEALISLYRFQAKLASLNNMVTVPPAPRRASTPVDEAKNWYPRDGVTAIDVQIARQHMHDLAHQAIAAAQYLHEDTRTISRWEEPFKPWPTISGDQIEQALAELIARVDTPEARSRAQSAEVLGDQISPRIWHAARKLWSTGNHREAVARAAEALVSDVKTLTGRPDLADTALWQEVFSSRPAEPGKPRLRWPGNPTDRTVKSINDGLRQFAPGIQLLIRNPAAHGLDELPKQTAFEQLCALSVLSRLVDNCILERDEPKPQGPADVPPPEPRGR